MELLRLRVICLYIGVNSSCQYPHNSSVTINQDDTRYNKLHCYHIHSKDTTEEQTWPEGINQTLPGNDL